MKPKIEKASVSFRLGPQQWLTEERFRGLLRLLGKFQGVTDELTFFTADTHAPIKLELMADRCNQLRERISLSRKHGYRAGINILATIGHHDENLDNSIGQDYTQLTDINGKLCMGSYCPNDDRFRREYIKKVYELLVAAQPDYIWIDDDVRLFGHMPIVCGCFCDNCLKIFAEEYGVAYSRESLSDAFNTGSEIEKLKVRKAWLQHNRNLLSMLFTLIEQVVHGLSLHMPLGFMTGDRFYEGYDFQNWADILSGNNKACVMWRPGGGFYNEDSLKELISKSHDVGRQVASLPDSISIIQSEIENFPYQIMKKSAHVTVLEAASHIAAGCTGAAFNVLPMDDEPVDDYVKLVSEIKSKRPFLDVLVGQMGRSVHVGVYSGWNKDSFTTYNLSESQWFEGKVSDMAGGHCEELLQIGMPAAYLLENAMVTALTGDMVMALNDTQIRKLLSSGVYMDAKALDRLNRMGYQEFTGFTFDRSIEADGIEQLIGHPINDHFDGRRRDGRMSFWWPAVADVLTPSSDNAQILARMVDYSNKQIASCCMGIFENILGGRVCVGGYFPWTFLQSVSKSSQIKRIMRWLSKDSLPAYVDSYHKVNMWVRESESGEYSIPMINVYSDTAECLTLALRTAEESICVVDMDCNETIIKSSKSDGPYKKFILPHLGAWQMCLVMINKHVG